MLEFPLLKLIPTVADGDFDDGVLLDRFLEFLTLRNFTLYPAQEEAVLALYDGQNVWSYCTRIRLWLPTQAIRRTMEEYRLLYKPLALRRVCKTAG